MKKLIVYNVLFCIIVIAASYFYFDLKAKKIVAYNYAITDIITNSDIKREDLSPHEIHYRIGMGLFEIRIKNITEEAYYNYEVDLRNDYSLHYIKNTNIEY